MKQGACLSGIVMIALCVTSCASGSHSAAAEPDRRAPDRFNVRLETSKGVILIEVHRDWAPRGADRFCALVRSGTTTTRGSFV
jgi:hypothetical protein